MIILGLLTLFAATQTPIIFTVIIVGDWAEQSQDELHSSRRITYILCMMGALVIIFIVRSILGFYFANKASQRLHDKMLEAVLRAKIEFFDCNPSGRILNRFSAETISASATSCMRVSEISAKYVFLIFHSTIKKILENDMGRNNYQRQTCNFYHRDERKKIILKSRS